MVDTAERPLTIRYQGPGRGTELLGAVQANFFVDDFDREYAVLVNEPALQYAAAELGVELTDAWRECATAVIGELVIRDHAATGKLEAIAFLGRSVFDEHPGLLEHLKRAFAAPQ